MPEQHVVPAGPHTAPPAGQGDAASTTGEGIFVLDRLPTPTEAEAIRDTLVIAKKRESGEPSEAQLAARAAFAERPPTTRGRLFEQLPP